MEAKNEEVGTQAGAANPAGEQKATDKKMPYEVVYCPRN